jgi:hypothetical protein
MVNGLEGSAPLESLKPRLTPLELAEFRWVGSILSPSIFHCYFLELLEGLAGLRGVKRGGKVEKVCFPFSKAWGEVRIASHDPACNPAQWRLNWK